MRQDGVLPAHRRAVRGHQERGRRGRVHVQHIHTKGMTTRTGMGQSRKSQVIAMGRSHMLRLYARARSYRVQIKGAPKFAAAQFAARNGHGMPDGLMWHDVQMIPRTHQREDVPYEFEAATNALNRRELELTQLI